MDPVAADFFLNFQNNFENVENQMRLRLEYRQIRDHSNPFNIPDGKFLKLFRLNKFLARNLFDEVNVFMDNRERINTTPALIQFLIALNFFGSGSYQTSVGQDLNLALSQPMVSRSIHKICEIFSTRLLPRYVKFPVAPQDIVNVKEGFLNMLRFPHTLGAIDCTHIAIFTPKDTDVNNPAVAYLNRKGFFSVNVQAICDASMVFLSVNARFPGSTHDAAIWQSSTINAHLRRRYLEGERNAFLIGDAGYPIQPWLMTPIPDAPEQTPEGNYTHRHCQARNVIERAFGVLKQRFKCLMKTRVLHYDHLTSAKIVHTCVILHNICRTHNLPEVNEGYEEDNQDDDDPDEANPPNLDVNVLTEGRLVRRNLINLLRND